MLYRINVLFLICIAHQITAEVDLITEPRPGEEFVLVSSGQERALNFESSHKIPEKLPTKYVSRPIETYEKTKKQNKEYTGFVTDAFSNHKSSVKLSGEGIISIEESKKPKKGHKQKVRESIEIDVPASKLEEIKIKESQENFDTHPIIGVDLEAMSETGRLIEGSATTTQKPILTTPRSYDIIPINFDSIDDINSGLLSTDIKLESAGSEQKQHSRIQIKKGPNGQDYEYEYIYYYEEEDDQTTKTNTKPLSTTESIHNAHDGPQKSENDNKILKTANDSKYNNKYSNIERTTTTSTAAPTTAVASEAQNEVVPSGQRSRYRGRNLTPAPVQEEVNEERLPASTRFPPRSRNLNTTPLIPETFEPVKQRGRPQSDSLADESIGQSRSRTRAHVRRPSSELVDLASFNTHSSDIPLSQYKELPSRFSAEGKTSSKNLETTKSVNSLISSEDTTKQEYQTNNTPREAHSLAEGAKAQHIVDDSKKPLVTISTTAPYFDRETTEYTTMMAMEKVALDLYAYLAGENLNNDFDPTVQDIVLDGSTTEMTTVESTTEAVSTTEIISTTVTTTTTTTTPPPTTTTTTTQVPTRASRFKNRGGARVRGTASTSTTETPLETSTKLKGRFSRPSFGASRNRVSTVAPASESPAEETVSKQEHTQTHSAPKGIGGRARFGGRTRPSTTSTTPSVSTSAQESSSAPEQHRARLRPTFHLRERRPLPGASTTTAANSQEASPSSSTATPSAAAESGESASEAPVAPVRSIGRGRLGGLRPLRPGPRLTIGRSSTAATPAASTEDKASETPANVEHHEEAASESTETTSTNPIQRLRGRPRLHVAATPKPKATQILPIRRPNPLISRRKPVAEVSEAPTETSEATATEASESNTALSEAPKEDPEPVDAVETTPAPKPLSNLLARRRLVQRRPGTVA